MTSEFPKVHQAMLDFAAGKINTDSAGYLNVPGHGDIKLSADFVASTAGRRSRPTGNASARWHAAVAVEMQHSRCDKKKAVALVVRKYPELRSALVAEANATSTSRSTASTSGSSTVRKQSPTAQFREEVQRLIDGGMEKMAAIKLLSQRMGLSSNEPSPKFLSTRQQYR